MSKTIHLNLTKKWFDMILCGDKEEEYREISPFYVSLLFDWRKSGLSRIDFTAKLKKEKQKSKLWEYFKLTGSHTITFSNGYKPDRMQFVVDWVSVTIGKGEWIWGAEYDKDYFVIRVSAIYTITMS